MLGSEGLQVQKNAHKGRNIGVFTSGGDSQGNILFVSNDNNSSADETANVNFL